MSQRSYLCFVYLQQLTTKFLGCGKLYTLQSNQTADNNIQHVPCTHTIYILSSNGLDYIPSLMAHFHVQMSKQVICSCPLPCEIRDRITLLYVKHVVILIFKLPFMCVYTSSGAVVIVVHCYSKDVCWIRTVAINLK